MFAIASPSSSECAPKPGYEPARAIGECDQIEDARAPEHHFDGHGRGPIHSSISIFNHMDYLRAGAGSIGWTTNGDGDLAGPVAIQHRFAPSSPHSAKSRRSIVTVSAALLF